MLCTHVSVVVRLCRIIERWIPDRVSLVWQIFGRDKVCIADVLQYCY